jgi:hypothetical protein
VKALLVKALLVKALLVKVLPVQVLPVKALRPREHRDLAHPAASASRASARVTPRFPPCPPKLWYREGTMARPARYSGRLPRPTALRAPSTAVAHFHASPQKASNPKRTERCFIANLPHCSERSTVYF